MVFEVLVSQYSIKIAKAWISRFNIFPARKEKQKMSHSYVLSHTIYINFANTSTNLIFKLKCSLLKIHSE